MLNIFKSIDSIFTIDPNSLNRKDFLVPLADSFNINHKHFSNRTSLCSKLKTTILDQLENTSDFATLEPISDIKHDHLVIWQQNSKFYAAHISSIYKLIQHTTISPYAIDYATGILQSTSPDEYSSKYDLGCIPDFLLFVNNKYKKLNITDTTEKDLENVPNITKWRFAIENYNDNSGEFYISPSLETLQHKSPRYTINQCLKTLEVLKYSFIESSFSFSDNIVFENIQNILSYLEHTALGLFRLHIVHPYLYILFILNSLHKFPNETIREFLILNFFENFFNISL
tara:strand:- start:585 stop:1442 length:858 start_codon:yes stop_codon:yes gene_type:complete